VHTGSTSRRVPQQAASQHHQHNDAGRPTTLSLLKSVPMARSRYAQNNVHDLNLPLNSLLFLQTCADECFFFSFPWTWGTERMIGSRRWKQSCSSLRKHRRLALDHLSQRTHRSQQNRALIRHRHQLHLSRPHQPQSRYRSYRGCRHQRRRSQAPWRVPCHRARVMLD
jgi:hypothetical protein